MQPNSQMAQYTQQSRGSILLHSLYDWPSLLLLALPVSRVDVMCAACGAARGVGEREPACCSLKPNRSPMALVHVQDKERGWRAR